MILVAAALVAVVVLVAVVALVGGRPSVGARVRVHTIADYSFEGSVVSVWRGRLVLSFVSDAESGEVLDGDAVFPWGKILMVQILEGKKR